MAKKLMVLVGILAVLLVAEIPALAQQGSPTVPVGATGDTKTVNFELAVEGTPPADATFHAQTVQGNGTFLTDPDGDGIYTGSFTFATASFPEGIPFKIVQATGTRSTPVGERSGAPQSTIEDFGIVTPEDGDTLSASVSFPDDGSNPPGPPPGEEFATLTFELTVEGTPPVEATFFGNVQFGEGGPGSFVPLEDSDGDGLYTGTTTASRFGPGPRPVPPGIEPLSFGVRIVQGTGTQGSLPGEPSTLIRDFGAVRMNDQTLSASVSFDEDGRPTPGTVTATGVLRGIDPECNECPRHAITDEASGTEYGLVSDPRNPNGGVDLNAYVDQQVTIYGVPQLTGPPNFLYVLRVESASDPDDSGDGGGSDDGSDGDGSDNGGSGGSGSGGSGSGGSDNSGSSGGGSDKGGSGGSDNSGSAGDSDDGGSGGIIGLLPSTGGGIALTVLGVGILLVVGGLLVRKLSR